MNIGKAFPVYCIEVTDEESAMRAMFFQFADYVAVAVDNSFVKISANHMSMDEQTLAFSLIAEGLMIVEAKFAASVIVSIREQFTPPSLVGIETKTKTV